MRKLLIITLLTFLCGSSMAQRKHTYLVVDPYQSVNWVTAKQYKANFHTHTNNSDGGFNAEYVVDTYAKNGYSILALTDHNLVTYPWTEFSKLNEKWEDRHPDSLRLLTFPANELSQGHHRGMFFAYIHGGGKHLDSTFMQIRDSSAISMFYHPGRYWKADKDYTPGEQYSIEWYLDFFDRYPSIVGVEVFNTPYDRYPYDRVLWDEFLTRRMPQRPIWGYSNDDMHGRKELMGNYQFMLMEELSVPALKEAFKNGASYFSHEPNQSGQAKAPRIDSVRIDYTLNKIEVFARDYTEIRWISGVKGEKEERTNDVIAHGRAFLWTGFSKPYVRFELINEHGITMSQPYGFEIR